MAKLKAGDAAWWRGMRMMVTEVFDGKFNYRTVDAVIDEPEWVGRDGTVGRTRPAFSCTSNIADAMYDEDLDLWYCPGIEGELPTIHIADDGMAEIVDPPVPTCTCEEAGHEHEGVCGAVTWRSLPRPVGDPPIPRCVNCRPSVPSPLAGGS